MNRPYGLLAELTYSCPLHCPYCSNPIRPAETVELDTEEWKRVVHEAAGLGVLQIGFSGGEPLQRKDLESLVQVARQAGLYTNLITSGLGLGRSRATRLLDSGLDNVQISFQAAEEDLANRIAGVRNSHSEKLRAVEIIKETGLVAFGPMGGIWLVVEAAVSERTAQTLVEEQEQKSDLDTFTG